MPRLSTKVVLNLHGLRRFREALESDLRTSEAGPIRDALKDWAVLMNRYLTRRWREGDNWPPLAEATLARKRRLGLRREILRATDQMYQAFAIEVSRKPGRISEAIPFGIRVGFGGGMQYPHDTAKGLTIAELASIHQKGGGRLPQRKIIVPPDTATRAKMRAVMQKAMMKVAAGGAG